MKRRARIAAWVLLFVFLGLCGRLSSVQILDHERYAGIQARQSRLHESLPAPRGRIFSGDGVLLAQSRLEGKSVYANPRAIADLAATARVVATALDLDAAALYRGLWERRERYFVWVKRRISLDEERRLEALNLDGIGFRLEPKRHYPLETRACHVLGFVGEAGGLEGVERRFEAQLSGEPGHRSLLRDALMNKIVDVDAPWVNATPGCDLYLTLNDAIQAIVEEELDTLCARWDPDSASALVMDPSSGAILALANRPHFDPNRVSGTEAQSRRNRAITDSYEPGSIFKPFTIAAVLWHRLATLEEPIDCRGLRCGYRSVSDVHGYAALPVREVLAKSSNIGTAKLALRLSPAQFREALVEEFGFGEITGVLMPGEAAGKVPALSNWRECDETVSNAFGQGLAVTPLQMLTAFNAFANGGRVYQPLIISRVVDAQGRVVAQAEPRYRQVASEDVMTTLMRDALEAVIDHGTGKAMAIKGYRLAGKTGTADIPGPKGYGHHGVVASFIAMAPVEEPVITVLVMANHPKKQWNGRHWWGGNVSGPPVSSIIERTLTLMGVPRDSAKAP